MNSVFRVVKRYKAAAGNVVPLRGPKVPTLLIHGRKYVLSDYWPAMSMDDEEPQEGGARLIDVGGNRFKYLWVYDTDRGIVAMWRQSDGDSKQEARASTMTHEVVTLERKGQLNRVTTEEFRQVSRFMHDRYEDNLKALREYADSIQSNLEQEAREALTKWFDQNLRGNIDRKLSEVNSGVIPFGFKVREELLQHKDEKQQARQWVVTQALIPFTQAKAYDIVSQELGIDAYDPPNGDGQDVQWAWHAVTEKILEEYLS